ncbi:hypothetical protein [Methylobacterium sp. SyP6R]|uniref:hypothetical protein n=1 Tax=Methylobacterium sp. SyP6R TaxID=2718876 RepID=UPI001F45D5AE|nr:hypothetical protein [Methylobacterium sp. SyP6R]MCF4130049.1 hypothetical protein [Methylobacterium sp. SyP6R]
MYLVAFKRRTTRVARHPPEDLPRPEHGFDVEQPQTFGVTGRAFEAIGSAMLIAFALLCLVVDALDDATLSEPSGSKGNQIRVLSLPRYVQDGGAED